ncbi:MAG: heavy-metal-associated domain-containing protein [Clostridia bacterium]|nr:heavy-metal-associated domain-containing protein [Clostridia bacterium]
MKKTYSLKEIDCANCAAKLERKLSKLAGVENVEINFMAQKMTLEASDEEFEEVLARAVAAVAKYEPDCRVIL